jgi:hypothetical protein
MLDWKSALGEAYALFQNFLTYSIGRAKVAKAVPAGQRGFTDFLKLNGGSILLKSKSETQLLHNLKVKKKSLVPLP